MIEVDAAAQAFIREMVMRRDPRPTALRVGVRGGGCTGYEYFFEWSDSAPSHTDALIHCGSFVIVTDPKSWIFLDSSTLSAKKSMMESGLFWKNPNALGSCGCGKSVTFDVPVI